MPSFGPILKAAVSALKSPAIPEAIARGTAENPAILAAVRNAAPRITTITGKDVPFGGVPGLETATRAMYDPTKTAAEHVQALKSMIGGFFHRDPDLDKGTQEKLYRGRWRHDAATHVADRDVAAWHAPLQRAPAEQARNMYDFMYTADEVAQALRSGRTTIRALGPDKKLQDFPLEKFQEQMELLRPVVQNDPEIQAAMTNVRAGLDQMFDDMKARGWQVPDHYLEDYTPIRRLNAVVNGLASIGGESAEGMRFRILESMQHRSKLATGARDADLLNVFRATRAEYYKKVAEHETFLDLMADKTVNLTENFSIGDEIPRGLGIYKPKAGMFGYDRKSPMGYMIDGATDAISDPADKIYNGGFVLPEPLIEALKLYHVPAHSSQESAWYRLATKAAKAYTVYNPANTWVNKISDPTLAILGLPGEKAHPLGVIKWMGTANRVAYEGAFGKKGTFVKIGDQTIDVWDLAVSEGVTGGTILHDLGGSGKVSEELLRLVPEAQRANESWLQKTKAYLEADRLAVEAAPRIAAGLEALERTGDLKEFGRVARKATLTYGPGAPQLATFPVVRAISPFLQFVGLASKRVMELQFSKGSRGRTLAALTALPVATMMWNTQNPEYEEAENSLKEYERNMTHIWLPQLTDPSKVRRDINGKPVALRIRYWVPEEMMRLIGLGNLATRVQRVTSGRDTPKQFAKEWVGQIPQSLSDLLTLPQIMKEIATGKTSSGQEMTTTQRIGRVLPITRIATEAYQRGEGYGPKTALIEGAKGAAEETMGLRFANVDRRDVYLLDAQLRDVVRARINATQALKTARRNGSPSQVKRALKAQQDAIKEQKRVVAIVKKERATMKATGTEPEKATRTIDAEKDAAIKHMIARLKRMAP